ncbi:MAG: hypothetical protein L0922_07365, partial [Candidatus Mariimomonas ferrooxydans]
MNNRREIIKELKKAMEFYERLGFKHLPIKKSDPSPLLEVPPAVAKQNYRVSDGAGAYAPNKLKLLK